MFSSQLIELLVADNVIGVPLPLPLLAPSQSASANGAPAQTIQGDRIRDPSVASYLGESAQSCVVINTIYLESTILVLIETQHP